MNEDSIIEKIRALLRLAKSDNAHEANLAMERAMAIAAKHCIDLAALSPDDDLNKIIGDHLDLPSRLAYEWKEALNIVHAYFNVHVTVLIGMSSQRAQIIGTKLDIELASYVVTYLVRACRQSVAKFKKAEADRRRKTSGAKIQNYIKGWFWGVRDTLRKQRQVVAAEHSGYQLMLDNGRAAREAAAQEFGNFKGPSKSITMPECRANRRAAFSGFISGTETQINPGLRGGAPLALK